MYWELFDCKRNKELMFSKWMEIFSLEKTVSKYLCQNKMLEASWGRYGLEMKIKDLSFQCIVTQIEYEMHSKDELELRLLTLLICSDCFCTDSS